MAKARTTETIDEPIKSDRPSQRTILPLAQRFAAYGDDSSDEEREEAVYNAPITVRKHPGSPITKSHHKTTPLTPDHAEKVKEAIDKLKSLNIIKSNKLSTEQKLISKAKKGIQELPESPIKNLIQVLYNKSVEKKAKKQTIDELEYSLKQEVLSLAEYETANEQPTHLVLKVSSIMQNLGIRLLSSNKVRELYFPNKPAKLGTFSNLPTDERITTLLQESIKKAFKLKTAQFNLLSTEEYNKLQETVLYDKQSFFTSTSNGFKLQDDIKNLVSYLIEQPENNTLPEVREVTDERKIKLIIDQLKQKIPGFITKGDSICTKHREKLPGVLKEVHGEQKYKDCILAAYSKLYQKQSQNTLITKSKEKLLDETIEEKIEDVETMTIDLTTTFKTTLDDKINKLKTEFTRPTLSDSTSFSAKDLSPDLDATYHGVETLFSYIRLIHCSAKRSLKNSKSDSDFDGATFGRGWSFDNTKNFAIIEQQTVSPNGLNSMVQYPYVSNYSALATKLKAFQNNHSKIGFKNHQVVSEIKSILKTGHLSEGITLSESFTRFLFTLTYHLFGTEVERHPAAAIHNIMALDLSNNDDINTDWLTKLPMSITKAVEVARSIQAELIESLDVPYYYDHNDSSNSPDDKEFQHFVRMEIDLAYEWTCHKEKASDLNNDKTLEALDNLCMEYYDISINVLGNSEHHGGEI